MCSHAQGVQTGFFHLKKFLCNTLNTLQLNTSKAKIHHSMRSAQSSSPNKWKNIKRKPEVLLATVSPSPAYPGIKQWMFSTTIENYCKICWYHNSYEYSSCNTILPFSNKTQLPWVGTVRIYLGYWQHVLLICSRLFSFLKFNCYKVAWMSLTHLSLWAVILATHRVFYFLRNSFSKWQCRQGCWDGGFVTETLKSMLKVNWAFRLR